MRTPRHQILAAISILGLISACGGSTEQLPTPKQAPDPATQQRLNRELLLAVRDNRAAAVERLLGSGASANAMKDAHYGDTALTIAARGGQTEIALLLIEAGADVDRRADGTPYGNTPLIVAVTARQSATAWLLVQHRANVHARTLLSGTGPTALYYAVDTSQSSVVSMLLAAGAVVERRDVQLAIARGNVEILGHLLAAGPDPSLTLDHGHNVVEETAELAPAEVRKEMLSVARRFLGGRSSL